MGLKRTKIDRITSVLICEAADKTCEFCGSQDGTHQCMHDISRTYVITRYDPRNLACGCGRCHYYMTKDSHLHHENFVKLKGAEEVQLNRERAHSGERLKDFEKEEIYQHYKKELKRIQEKRKSGHIGKIEIEVPEILL